MASKRTNFIPIKEFARRHEMTVSNIHVCKFNGIVPDCALSFSGKYYQIDEAYFLRRDSFTRNVYIEAQNNYFTIYDLIGNNSAIARLIIALGGTRSFFGYTQFMSDCLFLNKHGTILANRVNFSLWEFWRITRWLAKIVRSLGSSDEKVIHQYILDRN